MPLRLCSIKGTLGVINFWFHLLLLLKELDVPRLHWSVSKHSRSLILYLIVTSFSVMSLQWGFAFEIERCSKSLSLTISVDRVFI